VNRESRNKPCIRKAEVAGHFDTSFRWRELFQSRRVYVCLDSLRKIRNHVTLYISGDCRDVENHTILVWFIY